MSFNASDDDFNTFNFGRISGRANDNEIIVHHQATIDTVSSLNKLFSAAGE